MEPLFDVNKLMRVMSEILSDKYGVEITMRAVPKPDGNHEGVTA